MKAQLDELLGPSTARSDEAARNAVDNFHMREPEANWNAAGGPAIYAVQRLALRYPEISNGNRVAIRSSDDANGTFVAAGARPPYTSATEIVEFTTTANTRFVRVHGPDNMPRSWMMRSEDIAGLSPQQIQDKFALPSLPSLVSDVEVPAGTRVRVGEVAAQTGWGNGGATQFELLARLSEDSFVNTRPLR